MARACDLLAKVVVQQRDQVLIKHLLLLVGKREEVLVALVEFLLGERVTEFLEPVPQSRRQPVVLQNCSRRARRSGLSCSTALLRRRRRFCSRCERNGATSSASTRASATKAAIAAGA